MQKTYGDQGFTVVAISDEGPAVVQKFVKDGKLGYPIGVDPGGKTKRAFGVGGIPQAFLVNVDGRVIWEGHPGGGEYENLLKQELVQTNTYVPPKELHASLKQAVAKAKDGQFAEAIKLARGAEAAGDDAKVLIDGITAKAKARLARAQKLNEAEGRTYEALQMLQDLAKRYAGLEEATTAKTLSEQWTKDKAMAEAISVSQTFFEAERAEANGQAAGARAKYLSVAKATSHKLAAKAKERAQAIKT
jgi:hypothetical protein